MQRSTLFAMIVAVVFLLGASSPAMAQTAAAPKSEKVVHNTTAAIGMGLSVLGIGLGLGMIGFAALNGIARQPEQAGAIQGAMFIIAGLVEGAGIISLVLCLVTIFV
jgi:F-type H+-transporting ATPase subunit c